MIPTTKASLSKQRIGDILKRIGGGDPIEPEGPIWALVHCARSRACSYRQPRRPRPPTRPRRRRQAERRDNKR